MNLKRIQVFKYFIFTPGMGQFLYRTSSNNEESIRKEVMNFPVVIFTMTRCPYCVRAKHLLDSERIEYKENDLDLRKVILLELLISLNQDIDFFGIMNEKF